MGWSEILSTELRVPYIPWIERFRFNLPSLAVFSGELPGSVFSGNSEIPNATDAVS